MFKTLKSIWQGLTQKGKIFPHQLAFTLLIPLRNWALSPQQIAQRLHFVPHHRICCGTGYFSCVGRASAHRFFHFQSLIGGLKPTLRLIRLLIRFPLHPNHASHRKKRAPDAQPLPTSGAMRQNGNMPIRIRHPPPACFLYHTQFYLCVTTACRLKGVYVCI